MERFRSMHFLPRNIWIALILSIFTIASASDGIDSTKVDSTYKMKWDAYIAKRKAEFIRDNPPPEGVQPIFDDNKITSGTQNNLYDSVGVAYTVDHSTMNDSLDNDSTKNVIKSTVFAPVVASEVLGLNVLVWGWDRYVLDKTYARVGPSYWKRNLREGWEWDHNHWAINFYGHPYQGSMYYATARAGGYDFYASMLWAALGSSTWELFAETEYPSRNDLVMTSVGGSVYGEVLYRMSRKLYGLEEVPWYKQIAAFIIEPAGVLQRKMFGNRDGKTGNTAMDMDLYLGLGVRKGSLSRFGAEEEDELDNDWRDRHLMLGLDIEYGHPYTKVKRPFDYFTILGALELGENGNLGHLDVTGKLANIGAHGRGHWVDFATYLDYDTFYGEFATIGTISLGGGVDFALWLTPTLRFRMTNQLFWIMLGTTDMGYDDIIKARNPDYKSDKDNYQYSMGAKYALAMELAFGKRITLSNDVYLDALRTIPGSLPQYGSAGWDVVIFNYTKASYDITNRLSVAIRLDSYVKLATYSSEYSDPLSQSLFAYTALLTFNLF